MDIVHIVRIVSSPFVPDVHLNETRYRLAMASYIYSLDSSTTFNYLVFAASAFGQHSLVSSVGVTQSIIGAFCLTSPRPNVVALNLPDHCVS